MSRDRRPRHLHYSEQPGYREGAETRPPRLVRTAVVRCNRMGWSNAQIARRCQITEDQVAEILSNPAAAIRPAPEQKREGDLGWGGHRRVHALVPPSITASPHSDEWFLQNQASFVTGMRKAGYLPRGIVRP